MDSNKKINVLSLFDGMSCGRIALDRAKIPVGTYYASEIDKYAIKVSEANYPDIVRLGDVTKWREWSIDWASIDLLIAGSPCQGFSFAGKQLAFDDPRSALFFVFVDILNHIKALNPDIKFLLENVRMKKEYLAIISEHVGVEPVFINSKLLSAQSRPRYYWANWGFEVPEDKGILLRDIVEDIIDEDVDNYTLKSWIEVGEINVDFRFSKSSQTLDRSVKNHKNPGDKANCLMSGPPGRGASLGSNGATGVLVHCASMIGRRIDPETGKRADDRKDIKPKQRLEIRSDGKTNCLTTVQKDNYIVKSANGDDILYRKLTPIECERLQTVPDFFTKNSVNTRYQHDIISGNECNELELWKSVDSKNVISPSQVGKLNSAISTILGGLEMERSRQLGVGSIKLKFVSTLNAKESKKRLKVFVLSTTSLGKERSPRTSPKYAKYALNLSDSDRKGFAQGITANYSGMETPFTVKKEGCNLMGTRTKNTLRLQTAGGYIELLLNLLLAESCEKKRSYIILTVINTIITKAIFMSVNHIPLTLSFIASLSLLRPNLLEMDLSFLKTESISETSNTACYRMLGNGWTVDVIAHILRSMPFNVTNNKKPINKEIYLTKVNGEDSKNKDLDYIGFVSSENSTQRLDDGKNLSRNVRQGNRVYSINGKAAALSANLGNLGGPTGFYAFMPPINRGSCAKRSVQCVIIAESGKRFVGRNDCNNAQTTCPREPGEGYTKCKTICQQPAHAEINALRAAGEYAKGARAIVSGHTYVCMDCQQALYGAGIKSISVV